MNRLEKVCASRRSRNVYAAISFAPMSQSPFKYTSIDDWIAREAISFVVDSIESFNSAIDRMVAGIGASVELLGLGEALHGDENILRFRNRLFQRLVETHGYSAIAVESSFPRGKLVNEYVNGLGPENYDALQETGFSHGFGRMAANRELVEWMRRYNAEVSHAVKLQFYGMDSPTEMMNADSPRAMVHVALDYLASIDPAGGQERRTRMDSLLGNDADWENSAAMMDPSKSIGLSPAATSLRIEIEDLITELRIRRPELVAKSDRMQYLEAEHNACAARQFLDYHASMARTSANRTAELLGIRDLMIADNLEYAVARQQGRGKVFAFAHNMHLRCGHAQWQLGPQLLTWWPAGAQVREKMGEQYAVIGSAFGVSEAHGIGQPEAGTLESKLIATKGAARFIPTYRGSGMPTDAIQNLPIRSGSTKNSTYFPLTKESLVDFDWLVMVEKRE